MKIIRNVMALGVLMLLWLALWAGGVNAKFLISGELRLLESLSATSNLDVGSLVLSLADFLYENNDSAKFFGAREYNSLIVIRLLMPLLCFKWCFLLLGIMSFKIWHNVNKKGVWLADLNLMVKILDHISLWWCAILLAFLSTQLQFVVSYLIFIIEAVIVFKQGFMLANSYFLQSLLERRFTS